MGDLELHWALGLVLHDDGAASQLIAVTRSFLARASDGVERSAREDSGLSPQEMLRQMDVRLEAARQRLAAGKPRAGQ